MKLDIIGSETMLYGYYDELPKPLDKDKIRELLKSYKEDGNTEAFESLIVHNLLLVKYIIKRKFYSPLYNKDDLFSVGIMGLMQAIKRYDYLRNTNFSLYASVSIERSIVKYLKSELKHQDNLSLNELVFQGSKREVSFEELISDLTIDILEEMITKENIEFVYNLIYEIPNDTEREIMLLFFNREKNIKPSTIAKIFGYKEKNVYRIIAKNIRYIREKIDILESKNQKK